MKDEGYRQMRKRQKYHVWAREHGSCNKWVQDKIKQYCGIDKDGA